MASNAVLAQESQPPQNPATTEATDGKGDVVKVEIVGTRLSQQSSIERKKNAATAIDSIVAEDVGSLPDRNIGEAISRMAGIALDRGDYGEGINVSVRGNGPELTRVELDGQSVQSAGGSDMNGGGDGRATEFRQLSADLIKSVDVIKGQTADMSEGSLGGGIRIETRNGLDFKKPFVSVRASGTQSSLNKNWTPDLNIILSKKFLDDRLGVLLNAGSQKLDNESHQFQTAANGKDGYARFIDIDGSPEKTFIYQPGTLDMTNPASTTPVNTYSANGKDIYVGPTPLELLTKSANAQTKQDCFDAFPQLTTSSSSLSGLSSTNKTNAVNSRRGELLTCLNQWNDYSPGLLRYFVKRQIDERKNLDLRTDFKVNRELSVYAKGAISRRKVDDNYSTFNLGQVGINGTLADGSNSYTDVNNVRTAKPNSGWYTLPNTYVAASTGAVKGSTVNFDPATAVVDSTHHLIQFSPTTGTAGTDVIRNLMETNTKYLQLGGKYKADGLTTEFQVGDSASDFRRSNMRMSLSYDYGPATVSLGPNGTWGYTFANPPVLDNAALYVQPTQGTGKNPTVSRDRTISWQSPKMSETSERMAKVDLTYALKDKIPFFKRLKSGFNLNRKGVASWGDGGYTVSDAVGTAGTPGYIPAITVPGTAIKDTIRGCQDTAASAGTSTACQYGFIPNASPSLAGTYVVPMQQFQDALAAVLTQPATATRLFQGASGRPDNMIDNFRQIDVLQLVNAFGLPNYNYDCTKECKGSDGKIYQQPITRVRERNEALYVMADFGLDRIPFTDRALPFGWELEGNLGYRYSRTTVRGTGNMTFKTIRKTASYDPNKPDAAGGTVTNQTTKNTDLTAVNHVFLPSYNLALWVVPDQVVMRYSAAKSASRPPVTRLLAAGSCTYDERDLNSVTGEEEENMTCSTVGNPNLKGQSNFNQNLSVEWYPNKDTMFSAAVYKQEGKVGGYKTEKLFGVPVFAGTNEVDPITGNSLADVLFDYNTYVNGPVADRTGIELATKTAFTFLPWKLRNTGFDANLTRQRSRLEHPIMDPISGQAMPPVGEPRYSFNWALWYDDGKLNARVAVQTVGPIFRGLAPQGDSGTGLNTYPIFGFANSSTLPWNPGSPNWRDRRSFIDGKISYKWNRNVDFFIEGRNLTNTTQTDSIGSAPYADGTPNLQNYAYAGRRITIGMSYRNL
ncbi:TonB-dependent receptor [Massilia horti]|uniref:TonB-dependent receptor n=2 Tax=Massilia horti TaxID=2562153 RepID=A0A4Y9STP4_9BURK|nr:TonB-dependent receptor [Massilia horti]